MQAVDYSFSHPSPAAIAEAGYVGVLRYIGWDFGNGPRCISVPEYQALQAAGLQIDLVWETNATMVLRGGPGGSVDGAEARRLCEILGHTNPVYVAIDFDISPGQQATADDYQSAFSASHSAEFYGKYDVIEHAGTGWQCAAWSGYGSGTGGSIGGRRVSDKARLFQEVGYALGNSCDVNDVIGGAGDFQIGTDAPAQVPVVTPIPSQPDHVLVGTVIEVQTDLTLISQHNNDSSLDPQGIDGIWGPNTEAAVRSFQTQTNLDVDGIVGVQTITALRTLTYLIAAENAANQPPDQPVPVPVPQDPETPAPEWYPPSHDPFPGRVMKVTNPLQSGDDIRTYQEQMNARDPHLAEIGFLIDGVYGEQSKNVTTQFQAEQHLDVDGMVGPQTWNAAFEAPTS